MAISIKTRLLDTLRAVNKIPMVEKWLVQQSKMVSSTITKQT